jgi:anaerobic selenocysteine-containing dehydrogenase
MQNLPALTRAGFAGGPLEAATALFQKILSSPSGIVFAVDEWEEVLGRIGTVDKKIALALPDLLDELDKLLQSPPRPRDTAFPFVLSAGERRSFTANTIIRDPTWRKKDAAGALRINPDDAGALGINDGEAVRLTTRRGSAVVTVEISDTMQRGHVSLPNGLGLGYPTDAGYAATGVAPNELTAVEDRDPFVGTPWHKHVAARIARIE